MAFGVSMSCPSTRAVLSCTYSLIHVCVGATTLALVQSTAEELVGLRQNALARRCERSAHYLCHRLYRATTLTSNVLSQGLQRNFGPEACSLRIYIESPARLDTEREGHGMRRIPEGGGWLTYADRACLHRFEF